MQVSVSLPRWKTVGMFIGSILAISGLVLLAASWYRGSNAPVTYGVQPVGGTDYLCVTASKSGSLAISCFYVDGLSKRIATPTPTP